MTALFTALLESETKETLAVMVCDLKEEVEKLRKGWLDQAERDAREIVRLEVEIERLASKKEM